SAAVVGAYTAPRNRVIVAMYHQGASSRGWTRAHPPRGHRTPNPMMFVTRSIPATPFHRTAGWEYTTERRATRAMTTVNPCGPTAAVRGPGGGTVYETKFADVYTAKRRPRAPNPIAAQRRVSGSTISATTCVYRLRGFRRSVVPMS